MSFIAPPNASTITSVMISMSSVTGTVASSEFQAELQTDTGAGVPDNVALQTANCNQSVTGTNTLLTWTFSTALTAGVRYWIAWKNTNASPASNFPVITYGNSSSGPVGTPDATVGWARRLSTDSGSTWTAATNNNTTGMMVGYGDGSYDGYPFYFAVTTDVNAGIYSDRELGNLFTTPASVRLNVSGVRMHFGAKTGTPTGTPRAKIYQGTTLISGATSVNLYTTSPVTGIYELYFDQTFALALNTAHRIVIGETAQSDASGNRYNLRGYGVFNDANARALLPFGGTMQRTYWNGSTWTDSNIEIVPMELILDQQTPFGPPRAWILGSH